MIAVFASWWYNKIAEKYQNLNKAGYRYGEENIP